MRLIDADALLKALKANCGTLCNDKNTDWCEYCCPHNDFEDLIDNAPTVFDCRACKHNGNERECADCYGDHSNFVKYEERPQGEWIPVSERLPDFLEEVMVTDEIGKVFKYAMRPFDEEGNVCEEWTFFGRKIIAWMPLPEPYREVENDES